MIFPIITVLSLKASKTIDAGRYTIHSNIQLIITITAAGLLLHEELDPQQMLGASIIIASAFIITLPYLKHRGKARISGITTALIVFVLAALATVYERWMLTRIDFGSYLVIGWGFQTLWMLLIAWPERQHLRRLAIKKHTVAIWGYALASSIKGICFIAALQLSENASLFSAFISFTTILVVPAAYIFLRERDLPWLKLAAAVLGSIGLFILSTK